MTDPTLPSITDGITDAEAEASAMYDLTIDEVRALNSADYAVHVPPVIARMKRQHAEALDDVKAERDELLAANKLLQTKLDLIGGFGSAADEAALRVVQRRDASIERLTARIRQLHDARRAVEAERDALAAELADQDEPTGTDWGSGRDESNVRSCGSPNDAYDYARAYGERVFTRKLYAGPWRPDSKDEDDV